MLPMVVGLFVAPLVAAVGMAALRGVAMRAATGSAARMAGGAARGAARQMGASAGQARAADYGTRAGVYGAQRMAQRRNEQRGPAQ